MDEIQNLAKLTEKFALTRSEILLIIITALLAKQGGTTLNEILQKYLSL